MKTVFLPGNAGRSHEDSSSSSASLLVPIGRAFTPQARSGFISSLLKIPFLFTTALLIGLLLPACSGSSEGGEEEVQSARGEAVPVEAVTLTKGRLVEEIVASGTVKGIREATVVSETKGVIEEVSFELGNFVEPEETLVQVDDEIARLNMEQAEQQLETARIDLNSKEKLFDRGGASQAAVVRARSAYRGAEAQYQQAKKAYEDCTISSPISGYVADKAEGVDIGSYLTPGNPVARVVDLSSFRLEVSLGETSIGLIREGAEATVTIPAACEERVFTGTVVAVAAGSDPATGSYPVVIEWKNECGDRIKSGMSARTVISPRDIEPVKIIPTSALTERGGKKVVFIAEPSEGTSEVPPKILRELPTKIPPKTP